MSRFSCSKCSPMQFDEAETDDLKRWLIQRLEDISDADADVLADYVLALIKSDDPEEQVKLNCADQLRDFLAEHTDNFVKDVFAALEVKSYLPGYVAPKPAQVASSPPFNAPSGPAAASFGRPKHLGGAVPGSRSDQSRKRSYNEREGSEARDGRDPHYNRANEGGERAIKQVRRGGIRGGRGGQQNGFGAGTGFQQQPTPTMPTPPPGFPQLDPNNPMSAILAMQAMGFPTLPGFPQFPGSSSPVAQSASPTGFGAQQQEQNVPARIRERCKDYDTKGYCAAGSMCPYEHGSDHIVVPGDMGGKRSTSPRADRTNTGIGYDPNNASLSPEFTAQSTFETPRSQRGNQHPRGRGSHRGGRGPNFHGRGGRASFSFAGPNFNQSITSVVVEQIPEEKFTEDDVREFFGEFGEIEDVTMQAYKRLAIVKYKNYGSARRAYDSPKVIFDNRFVKVYWYKPESVQEGVGGPMNEEKQAQAPPEPEDEDMIDPAEFAEKQAAAQRVHEEKARKMKEAEALREELDKKLKAQAEERKRLMEKLAARTVTPAGKSGGAGTSAATTNAANGSIKPADSKDATAVASSSPGPSKAASQTDALRAKLAELEAEATNLGLNSEDQNQAAYTTSQFGRGRGGFNPYARGGYRGRGGAWRGGPTALASGGVARLDNRPRNVEVRAKDGAVNFGDESVLESLRAHLFGIGEFASITPSSPTPTANPTKHDSAIVAFNQRYVAEMFISSSSNIPGIGATSLAWVPNAAAPSSTAAAPSSTSASTAPTASSAAPRPGANGSPGVQATPTGTTTTAPPASATTKIPAKLNPAAMDFAAGKIAAPATKSGIGGGVTGAAQGAGSAGANRASAMRPNGTGAGGKAKVDAKGDTEMGEGDYDVADDDDRWMR